MTAENPKALAILSLPRVVAVGAGNALEFYSFIIFGLYTPQLGAALFPAQSDSTGLFLLLATLGVGFLARPLGGAVIGIMGDMVGRKPALLTSFGLMGLAMAGLALTPSYAEIGLAAPLLAISFRLLQGFALGGEVGPASAFLLEAAPASRRGLYVSLQFSTQWLGGLAANLVVLLLARLLAPAALAEWGWRLALLLGVAVVPLGLIARWRLPETLGASDQNHPGAPIPAAYGLFGLMMLAGGTVATYTMSYLGAFGDQLGLPGRAGLGAVIVCGVCGALFNPLGGMLSDRLGRKKAMLAGMGGLLLAAIPCFAAIAALRSPLALWLAAGVMTSLLALATPSLLAILLEALPPQFRSGGVGIVYALAISIFGGSAQFVLAWLIAFTGSPLAPGYYLVAALGVGLAGMAAMHEPVRLKSGV